MARKMMSEVKAIRKKRKNNKIIIYLKRITKKLNKYIGDKMKKV